MDKQLIFNFKTDISGIHIPAKLNNPFEVNVPDIVKIAAKDFQKVISSESKNWAYDFHTQKGKMFGVLVVQKKDLEYGYLGTVSGKLPGNATCDKFVPSLFDDASDDFFINKGMTELTEIGNRIKNTVNTADIVSLKAERKQKSIALQHRLFEHYNFLNLSGAEKNLLDIFRASSNGIPPSAAGECAAPKLLHFAIKHHIKPIALAEFWWGNPMKSEKKAHNVFYPACKSKCRPILEYMLEDTALYDGRAQVLSEDKFC